MKLYYTDVLSSISATIYIYGHDTKETKKDTETLTEMIEAIEKHGEIELFYEV